MRSYCLIAVVLAAALAAGCVAKVHPGRYAVEVPEGAVVPASVKDNTRPKADLVISGREIREMSSTYFGFVDFALENTTAEWLKITDIKPDFGDEAINKNVSIVIGDQLAVWSTAIKARNAIRQYNRALLAVTVAAIGGAIGGSQDNQGMQALGDAALIAGMTYLAVDDVGNVLDKLNNARVVPRDYLIGNTIVVPPGLFIRHWLLFYTKQPEALPYLESLIISCKVNDQPRRFYLEFRTGGVTSEWRQSKGLKPKAE